MIEHLVRHLRAHPDKTAYVFLDPVTGNDKKLTYSEFSMLVEQLGLQLLQENYSGAVAMLVYDDVLHFLVAFFACTYAGIIPVPVLYSNSKRQTAKMLNIFHDSGAELILTTKNLEPFFDNRVDWMQGNQKLNTFYTDLTGDACSQKAVSFGQTITNDTAFIQYTSGSTGIPKGVVVSQKNLEHNHKMIQKVFATDSNTVLFSWLPFQHDMGLVGHILHNIFVGGTCVLMSPFHFIQKPLRWLEGISKYRATHSGAPNFAFDHCVNRINVQDTVGLDLSSWKFAYCGAEPVKSDTIQKFCSEFAGIGFNAGSFYPCYGMAESTLIVSGVKDNKIPEVVSLSRYNAAVPGNEQGLSAADIVSCGKIPVGLEVIIKKDDRICVEEEEGEVLVAGESVTQGYWKRDNAGLFEHIKGRQFIKTGDLGFFKNEELYICGRIKEMLIVRGRNIYPYDLERVVTTADPRIEKNGAVAFETQGLTSGAVIVVEIKRSAASAGDYQDIIIKIVNQVTDAFELTPVDVVLVQTLGIPRTTSGKLMRIECRKMYETGKLTGLDSKLEMEKRTYLSRADRNPVKLGARNDLEIYLMELISSKTGNHLTAGLSGDASLTALGLDSLRMMELINKINNDFGIQLELSTVLENNTFQGILENIGLLLWIKQSTASGTKIAI